MNHRILKVIVFATATLTLVVCSNKEHLVNSDETASIVSSSLVYGGQTYKTVVIGKQTWMAENLNFKTSAGSWCYGGADSNCTIYGRLYNYDTAMTVCPVGWHLPGVAEWDTLEAVAGVNKLVNLKSKTMWKPKSGTDSLGFTALPGGYRDSTIYLYGGEFGYWWTATSSGKSDAFSRNMYFTGVGVFHGLSLQSYGFSVRCLKNS